MDNGTLLLILAAIGAFFMAFNNGANDVANSFASAVGAEAISIRQAVFIAGAMNFLGAVLLGGYVSSKLITGVINPSEFSSSLDYMLAMFAVLLASGVFVLIATLFSLPVSSSHAIVGSLIGVSAVVGGMSSVNWPMLGAIIGSWFISPVLAAVFSISLLTYIQNTIFKDGQSGRMGRLQFYLCFVLALTVALFILILMKGSSLKQFKPTNVTQYLIFAAVIIPIGAAISYVLLRLTTSKMSDNDNSVETVFRRLQIGTSSYVAFAHGANDVANSIAPVFAIYLVLKHKGLPTDEIVKHESVPIWILVLGGIGIAVGIASLGHRVIETLSKKITRLNNSRGFSVDFSAASTVVLASLMGLPVSSTHAATGAIIGTGLRDKERVKQQVLVKIFAMWIVTVPAAGIFAVGFYFLLRAIF